MVKLLLKELNRLSKKTTLFLAEFGRAAGYALKN